MKVIDIVESNMRPSELEVTDAKVLVASNIQEIEREGEKLFQYRLVEYDKNEYIVALHMEQEEQNEVLDYLLMED